MQTSGVSTGPIAAAEAVPPCEPASVGAPEIFAAITDLARRLRQFENRTLKESGLSPPQFYILSLLSEADGRPVGELAAASSCRTATMTGIVDTLERKSLVRRGPNPADRRGTLVWLTDEGRALFASTGGLGETFGSCCCELLPPDESAELVRLLARLAEDLPF